MRLSLTSPYCSAFSSRLGVFTSNLFIVGFVRKLILKGLLGLLSLIVNGKGRELSYLLWMTWKKLAVHRHGEWTYKTIILSVIIYPN